MSLTIPDTSYIVGPVENPFDIPVSVGSYTAIARNLWICGGQHSTKLNRQAVSNFPFFDKLRLEGYHDGYIGRPVVIGHDCWIGDNCTLLEGVVVGNGAIIGAGSVVAKSVPHFAVVVGNPARIMRFRVTTDQAEALERIRWWDWSRDTIEIRIQDFNDITTFIELYEAEE